ncbi:hypothetical protein HRI_003611500 [Hibiscus trionum]|uniref:Uncharacterized protein n=1 Tax=Hibiscus trionum TaxID=183268 RepID=A0A9W7MD47_HIBTR|nr:hypothetical protein HRI_003611500 [Hibiscus trionum]
MYTKPLFLTRKLHFLFHLNPDFPIPLIHWTNNLLVYDRKGGLGMGQQIEEVKSAEKEISLCKLRINELEKEIKSMKESEKNLYDSLVAQTKELQQTKLSLQESRQQIISLHQTLDKMEASSLTSSVDDLSRATSKAKMLTQELNSLKTQLNSTRRAEENNQKALEDLALALKEVRTEANEAKDKLEKSNDQVKNLKLKLQNMEAMYNEAKNEAETFKYISERLTLEAEENLLQWNMKEIGFVDCMKKLEDERNAAQEENKTLLESLTEAQNMYRKAMEENEELRDNKKQVENESRKVNGSTNFEIIREWKLLFCEEQSNKHKDGKEQNKKPKQHKFSTPCLNLKFPYKVKDVEDEAKQLMKESDEESVSELSDLLRGSIFDVAETPKAGEQDPKNAAFDAIGEEYYHIETGHFYEEHDRTSRKKRALLGRFTDLIKIRSFH